MVVDRNGMPIRTGAEFYSKIWLPLEYIVAQMEEVGLRVDSERVRGHQQELQAKVDACELEFRNQAWLLTGNEVMPSSPQQLARLLYEDLEMPIPPIMGTEKAVKLNIEKKPSTSAVSLRYLKEKYPNEPELLYLIDQLMGYKADIKSVQFCAALLDKQSSEGRIHCVMSPDTETGRLIGKLPNMLQMPPVLRDVFVADQGESYVCLDESALEWRILAHILAYKYGDFSLVREIEAGIDPHSATAMDLFNLKCAPEDVKKLYPHERLIGKTINYSVNYGKSAAGLAAATGTSVEEARYNLEKFYQVRPGIAQYHKDTIEYAREHGIVRSLLGRKAPIPGRVPDRLWRPGMTPKPAERCAMNYPLQMSAMDIMAAAMLELADTLDSGRMVLQIHDELLVACPGEVAYETKEKMNQALTQSIHKHRVFLCPLESEGGIGSTWKEAGGK